MTLDITTQKTKPSSSKPKADDLVTINAAVESRQGNSKFKPTGVSLSLLSNAPLGSFDATSRESFLKRRVHYKTELNSNGENLHFTSRCYYSGPRDLYLPGELKSLVINGVPRPPSRSNAGLFKEGYDIILRKP